MPLNRHHPSTGVAKFLNLTRSMRTREPPSTRARHLQGSDVSLSGGSALVRYYSGIEMNVNRA